MIELANDPYSFVRKALAENPELGEYCGKECMLKLANDSYNNVKVKLCHRKDLDKYCPECVQICGKI